MRFAQKHENEIREMCEAGATCSQIAKTFGVAYTTASNGVKELELEAVKGKRGPQRDTLRASCAITEEEIRSMYIDQEMTTGQIATACGVSRQTVYNTLDRYGIDHSERRTQKSASDELDPDLLRKMVIDKDMSVSAIAEELGISPHVVSRAIRKNDIPSRIKRYAGMLTEENLRQWYLEENRSLMDIAEQVGCNYNTVARACKRYGFEKTRQQISDTMTATMRKRYGVSYAVESEAIREKIRLSRSPEFKKKVAACEKIAPQMIEAGATVADIAIAIGCSYRKTRDMLVGMGYLKGDGSWLRGGHGRGDTGNTAKGGYTQARKKQ